MRRDIIYSNSELLNEFPITYTVELTDDGESFMSVFTAYKVWCPNSFP